MKEKSTFRCLLYIDLIIIFLLIAGGLLFINYQNHVVSNLTDRFKQENIPLKDIAITSRVPFSIAITLQSKNDNIKLSAENAWNLVLADMETQLLYKKVYFLHSYALNIVNSNDEEISSIESFLSPSNLSKKIVLGTPGVDDTSVSEMASTTLVFGKFVVKKLDVFSDSRIKSSGKVLDIAFSTQNLESANESWLPLWASLQVFIGNANQKNNMSIILCHLTITDEQRNILLTWIQDEENGETTWGMVQGFRRDWFPQPQDIPEK